MTYTFLINLSYHLQQAFYFCHQSLAPDIYRSRCLWEGEFVNQIQAYAIKKVGVTYAKADSRMLNYFKSLLSCCKTSVFISESAGILLLARRVEI